jgi:hypothetical protein
VLSKIFQYLIEHCSNMCSSLNSTLQAYANKSTPILTHPYALTQSLETHSQVRKDVDGSRKHMMEVNLLIRLQSHLNGITEILKFLGHSSAGFEA